MAAPPAPWWGSRSRDSLPGYDARLSRAWSPNGWDSGPNSGLQATLVSGYDRLSCFHSLSNEKRKPHFAGILRLKCAFTRSKSANSPNDEVSLARCAWHALCME